MEKTNGIVLRKPIDWIDKDGESIGYIDGKAVAKCILHDDIVAGMVGWEVRTLAVGQSVDGMLHYSRVHAQKRAEEMLLQFANNMFASLNKQD